MNELASKYGFQYETTKAAIDESAIGSRKAQPGELVKLLAKAKADAIIERLDSSDSHGYLLTCDQVSPSGISEKHSQNDNVAYLWELCHERRKRHVMHMKIIRAAILMQSLAIRFFWRSNSLPYCASH